MYPQGRSTSENSGPLPSGNRLTDAVFTDAATKELFYTGGTALIHHPGCTKPALEGGRDPALSVIRWQDGTIDHNEDPDNIDHGLPQPNGCTLEDVLGLCAERLRRFNSTSARCRENSLAVTKIEEALHWLDARTARRRAEGIEGTYLERQAE